MIFQNVDFPGFAEAVPLDTGGVRMQRVPELLRASLNERAQHQVLRTAGNELRCVSDDGYVKLTLAATEGGVQAIPFFGAFQANPPITLGSEPQDIELQPTAQLRRLDRSLCADMPFSPDVIRLIMQGGGSLVFHAAEGSGLRPPRPEEVPALRLLTYGTSITHGAAATRPHLSYVRQLAWRLGADLVNLGVGGACHCEAAFADYIAAHDGWDVAVLALSVNMIGAGFTTKEFAERVSYMLNTVAGADTTRPVCCVTIYPHLRDFPGCTSLAPGKAPPEAYRDQLRAAVANSPHPNVHLIEGPEILDNIAGLTTDLVHPGDLGMIRMGEALAARLRQLTP